MGDDTPTPGFARVDRRAADYLKQSFAQVTNPPIDPERERLVVDLRVHVGRRSPLLGGMPHSPRMVRLVRPLVVDPAAIVEAIRELGSGRVVTLDATWPADAGPDGLARALDRLAEEALRAARRGAAAVIVSDRNLTLDRLPLPSVFAVGAVHSALTEAGLRGRTDVIAESADVLDVHALAMTLAAGARAVHPWLAIELAAEVAGTRGAEGLTASLTTSATCSTRSSRGFARRSRGWASAPSPRMSAVPSSRRWTSRRRSSLGASRPLSAGRGPSGSTCSRRSSLPDARLPVRLRGSRQPRRPPRPAGLPPREPRLPDPGLARFRSDGEHHLFAPRIVAAIQGLAGTVDGPGSDLASYRAAVGRDVPAVVRDRLEIRPVGAPPCDSRRRGGAGARHRPTARGQRDERRGALARGPPGPDDRHAAGRRHREHRRGRRGPRLVRTGPGRRAPGRPDQAGRLGAIRGDRDVSRPGRAARDQDGPGLEARRGRSAARPEGDRLHRGPPARPGGPGVHQPAAPSRHLLDRGPRPAHRRPAGDQPDGEDRREARRVARRRHHRRGRHQGRRRLHPPRRRRRRNRAHRP